jgi:hypothetical protein
MKAARRSHLGRAIALWDSAASDMRAIDEGNGKRDVGDGLSTLALLGFPRLSLLALDIAGSFSTRVTEYSFSIAGPKIRRTRYEIRACARRKL